MSNYKYSELDKEQLIELANANDADGQYALACYYFSGKSGVREFENALFWMEKAASLDHFEAQKFIGNFYANTECFHKAFKYVLAAAEKGDAEAQEKLGRFYEFGKGTEEDVEQAIKWYEKAADQGNAKAQEALGYCYFYGNGIEEDYDKAFFYLPPSFEKAPFHRMIRYATGKWQGSNPHPTE